jgi:hypothetical protein
MCFSCGNIVHINLLILSVCLSVCLGGVIRRSIAAVIIPTSVTYLGDKAFFGNYQIVVVVVVVVVVAVVVVVLVVLLLRALRSNRFI